MRTLLVLLLATTLVAAFPLAGQEKEMAKEKKMTKEMKAEEEMADFEPPQPLSDEFIAWMVGEWHGVSKSDMGESEEKQKVEWSLDKQFVEFHVKSKVTSGQMEGMVYKGSGPFTKDPQSGEYVGYWFDNFRGMYKGTGKMEGNKIVMTWEGPMGTATRTIEKVGEDKMVQTHKETQPDGTMIESRTELTRKKKES